MNSSLDQNTLYHIYNRGNWKQDVFLDDEDYKTFKNLLRICFSSYNFDLLIVCVMPNHYHMVINQRGNRNISECMYRVGLLYARYFNNKYDTAGHVFQGTFKSKAINDCTYYKKLINYIKDNPKDAGLADKGEYKHLYMNELLIDYYTLHFEKETDLMINNPIIQ